MGYEVNKESGMFETIAFVDVVTGISAGTSVTSASVTANSAHFYVVAIEWKSTATITSVTGLSLTWTFLNGVVNGTSTNTSVYYAAGTGIGASGTVTVNFSASSTNSIIAVSRYSGVKFSSPITANATATGTSSAVSATITNGTIKGMTIAVLGSANQTDTPGSSFVEQNETNCTLGGGGAAQATESTNTKVITVAGAQTFTGTLTANANWGVVIFSLEPANAVDPILLLTYQLSAVTGATSSSQTITLTSDNNYETDITSDRAWVATDIPNVTVNVKATTISAAKAFIDQIYLKVVEAASGGSVTISFMQLGA